MRMKPLKFCLCVLLATMGASALMAQEADSEANLSIGGERWLAESLMSDEAFRANETYLDCIIFSSLRPVSEVVDARKPGTSKIVFETLRTYYKEKYVAVFSGDRAK